MSARKKKTKRTPRVKKFSDLPSLTDILDAFTDARAMVSVACDAILPKADTAGDACLVMHLGVRALDRVAEELEEAEVQFDEFRKQHLNAVTP
jgi:hypothetical protein